MSELLRFKKSIIRGVSQHFLREQDRIQSDIDMYNHFVTICVARVNSTYNPPVHDVSIERNSQPHCDTNSGHMIQTDNGKQVRSLITSNSQPHYDTFSSTPTKFYVSVESLEFAQKTLEKSQNELDVTKFYYTTPYAYAVRCLSEISDLMHAHDVTYEMTSTITSCIFSLMCMMPRRLTAKAMTLALNTAVVFTAPRQGNWMWPVLLLAICSLLGQRCKE